MWSNRNGQPLLAGIRNGTATLRESLAVSYITNHTLTIGSSSYLLLEFTQRNWKLVVQSLSCAWLFVTLWTAARQVSLSVTNSWSLLKLISTESVMSSNHLVLCCPFSCLQPCPVSGPLRMSQLFASGGRSVGASASASVLPMNSQDWFTLGLTGLIS